MTVPDEHEACRNVAYWASEEVFVVIAEIAADTKGGPIPNALHRGWLERLLKALRLLGDI